jgi:hypothetical protein
MGNRTRFGSTLIAFLLALLASTEGRRSVLRNLTGSRPGPPANAAARITSSDGACIRFISVFVPAQGGDYVVGLSFAYRDMNRDGTYTPGIDKLDVCVNCSDACDWGP